MEPNKRPELKIEQNRFAFINLFLPLLLSALKNFNRKLDIRIACSGFNTHCSLRNIFRKEQVLDSWSILIENGQGKADEVFGDTENYIRESKAPAIDMRRKEMAPGIIRGVLGTKRDFLAVTVQGNLKLAPYQIYINAETMATT